MIRGQHSVSFPSNAVSQSLQEQLNESYDKIEHLETCIADLREVISDLAGKIEEQNIKQTAILEIYDGIKVLVKVFSVIQSTALGISRIAAATAVVWIIWKFAVAQTLSDALRAK